MGYSPLKMKVVGSHGRYYIFPAWSISDVVFRPDLSFSSQNFHDRRLHKNSAVGEVVLVPWKLPEAASSNKETLYYASLAYRICYMGPVYLPRFCNKRSTN